MKRALADVEKELEHVRQTLQTKVSTPLSSDYISELDESSELDSKEANYYQDLFGIVQWIVELGCIEIMGGYIHAFEISCKPRRRSFIESIPYRCIPEAIQPIRCCI